MQDQVDPSQRHEHEHTRANRTRRHIDHEGNARIGENIEVVGASRFEAQDDEVLASYVHPPAQKIGVLVRAQGSVLV